MSNIRQKDGGVDSVAAAMTVTRSDDQQAPEAAPSKYDEAFFRTWRESLEAKLCEELPQASLQAIIATSQTVQDAVTIKTAAQKKVDQLSKQKPVDEEALAKAKQELAQAQKALQDSLAQCQDVAANMLAKEPIKSYLASDFDDNDLLTWQILNDGGDADFAHWCALGQEQTDNILALLHDEQLQRSILQAGGARHGKYGPCAQIYALTRASAGKNEVLQRLALAVALELCDPPKHFGTADTVDPIQRYIHYEQAYLFGELDPAFEQFSVWEMRMTVDSNAPDTELGWGRQCLMNYRPDYVTLDGKWRYCRLVRSDVPYKHVEWYREPHSFDQILSGGGVCGPRAFFGRFICKAFGMPTWGVTQPGHAAMSCWTPQGWEICLGAGFPFSYWEGRAGNDFLLETQARAALQTDEAYLQKVRRIEFAACFSKESNQSILKGALPSPASPWFALSLMQRKICAAAPGEARYLMHPRPKQSCRPRSKIERLVEVSARDTAESAEVDPRTGIIVLPAATCSSPAKPTQDVLFLPSFLGGKQLHLQHNATIEYTLCPDTVGSTARKYQLTCLVCTVHRHELSFLLQVKSTGGTDPAPASTDVVDLPYTVGQWGETKPVVVELGGPDVSTNVISVTRQDLQYTIAFAIKQIKLVPV